MQERIEPETDVCDALGVATKILIAQAFALDRLFFRAAMESAVSGRPHYHARKALKAQARCRATFKVLLALRAACGDPKNPNLTEGTIQTLKTPRIDNGLLGDEKLVVPPTRSHRPRKRPGRKSWSPERRARQAAAIREWQPWRNSSGPRTPEGKVRSARNALKHGHKSRAYVEMLREDRRILKNSAGNLVIAKTFLGSLLAKCERRAAPASLPCRLVRRSPAGEGGSCGAAKAGGWIVRAAAGCSLSPNWYWPSAPRADTFRPQILGESRSFRSSAGGQRGPATTMEDRPS
jgi:hypothetical protein